jgi:alkanesulfonate monooxygenase SsuD/methylene tetrahydromethanopterin reductase-like flavin-dependent oxidoreductase (luciferase family)
VAYADPLVFGAAVAMRTENIPLGFAVIEAGLHHPIRLAVQLALLDNLSKGRLMVGLARGSTYSAFEFRGFGTSAGEAMERTEEFEDLLVKAWTAEDGLEYKGKYWDVAFPEIRPRPFQKPHPPIWRACVTPGSVEAMAKIGRPILLRTRSAEGFRDVIKLYTDTMLAAGFSEEAVERNLDQVWLWRDIYVAETESQAVAEFQPGFEAYEDAVREIKARWSPATGPDTPGIKPRVKRMLAESLGNLASIYTVSEMIVGTPEYAKEQFAVMKEVGVRNVLVTHRGVVTAEQGANSMRLLAEKVFPSFR